MKPVLEHIKPGQSNSFKVEIFKQPYFTSPWHFHSEYELVLIVEGYGKLFIGDNVIAFGPGELVLLGKDIPHVWICDKTFYDQGLKLHSCSIVAQFSELCFPLGLLELIEFKHIKELLKRAMLGISFQNTNTPAIKKQFLKLASATGLEKYTLLIAILQQLAKHSNFKTLINRALMPITQNKNNTRLEKVISYIVSNYSKAITISNVANIANMNESSFCRYFKSQTDKTVVQFLNEIRIGYACKLILDGRLQISQIGYECGFNNLSYFHRQFKAITGTTPAAYKLGNQP